MLSYSRPIKRCRPLLGTFVHIRVHGLAPERAHAAIDAAFAEIATIHGLMSFHEPDSDVSRLSREAHERPVAVDFRTYEVLLRSRALSDASDGAFDITVASALVARGVLPRPKGAPEPAAGAGWRDIALLGEGGVRFKKPLWLDLGGIAKGYAVDRAIEALRSFAPTQACVNAGGDLRVIGPNAERIHLAPDRCESGQAAVIDLEEAALASSCGKMLGRRSGRTSNACHVNTLRGRAVHRPQFVSVVAPRCIDADALTKVVMARGVCSSPLLAKLGARAFVHGAENSWYQIPESV